MTHTLAVCNQKGGVGKSTTAVNVGAYLAIANKRTLLVDLDPQGNASTACGISRRGLVKDSYAVLINGMPVEEAITQTAVEGLDIMPASLDLAGAETHLTNVEQREGILQAVCQGLLNRYDYVIIDCPPSLGLLTLNALVAAQRTIIPVQCEYLSLEGLNSLTHAMHLLKQKLNPTLEVGGILLTMTDFRARLSREVAEEVRSYFKHLVFQTAIPRSIRLAEAPSFGKPIAIYDPHSTGALAYQNLTQEILVRDHPVEANAQEQSWSNA